MRNMRDLPYSPDEDRVVEYLLKLTGGQIGAGDDPIGFLIASHASMRKAYVELVADHDAAKGTIEEMAGIIDRGGRGDES